MVLRYPRVVVRFFFFQAEDGIRDLTVTGVQTCALPLPWHAALRKSIRIPSQKATPSPNLQGRSIAVPRPGKAPQEFRSYLLAAAAPGCTMICSSSPVLTVWKNARNVG